MAKSRTSKKRPPTTKRTFGALKAGGTFDLLLTEKTRAEFRALRPIEQVEVLDRLRVQIDTLLGDTLLPSDPRSDDGNSDFHDNDLCRFGVGHSLDHLEYDLQRWQKYLRSKRHDHRLYTEDVEIYERRQDLLKQEMEDAWTAQSADQGRTGQ